MLRSLLICLVAIGSVCGQGVLLPRFGNVAQIQTYLSLTGDQLNKMQQQIDDFNNWSSDRQGRVSQVQDEITVETAKNPLDPSALGLRYAEIESIRREIADRATKLIAANTAVLTEAQKAKLKVLEEALKLASTGTEARTLKLLPDACPTPTPGDYFPGGVTLVPIPVCATRP